MLHTKGEQQELVQKLASGWLILILGVGVGVQDFLRFPQDPESKTARVRSFWLGWLLLTGPAPLLLNQIRGTDVVVKFAPLLLYCPGVPGKNFPFNDWAEVYKVANSPGLAVCLLKASWAIFL